jgi:hypothetical protein
MLGADGWESGWAIGQERILVVTIVTIIIINIMTTLLGTPLFLIT